MSRRPLVKGNPPKKEKQQAASLARRMAGKKGQTTQLQVEVNNEEDWEKLLSREGLIVVDVYSEWSGPCVGMIGNLKKAKVDFGGDALHLAIAKNDEIEDLARFRNRSEPTWLFAAGGQLVTVTFGANAPKLIKMMEHEVKQELRVMRGETWRNAVHGSSMFVPTGKELGGTYLILLGKQTYINQAPISELCQEERERLEAAEKLKQETERQEVERIGREIEEKRLKIYNQMSEHLLYETVVICFPHTIDPESGCIMTTELDLFWRTKMMYVAHQNKLMITKDLFREVFFRGSLEPSDDLFEDLESGPCLVLLIKCQIIVGPGQEGEKFPGDMEKLVCESLNGVQIEKNQELVIPSPNSIPGKYPYVKKLKAEGAEDEGEGEEPEIIEQVTDVPGCWTPASHITKCAAIRYLFPVRAEKVMTPEEPPAPPKIVIAFDVTKHKECFDLIEEHQEQVLNYGYFTSLDPATAEPLCVTPEQYTKVDHSETDKLVLVINKTKSEPLLTFAGLGAAYVSANEEAGKKEADLFFPPGVEPRFYKLEEAELAEKQKPEQEEETVEEQEEENEEGSIEQNEDDLMALLGVTVE